MFRYTFQKGENMLRELDLNNFKEETKKGVKLIEFYTSWCGYCKKQQSELNEMDKIWIGQIDADNNEELAAEYGVSVFPTFLILKDGRELERFSGLRKKEEIMQKIMKYL